MIDVGGGLYARSGFAEPLLEGVAKNVAVRQHEGIFDSPDKVF